MPNEDQPAERRDSAPSRQTDIPFKNYVDAKIEPVADRMRSGDVTLREYVEALFGGVQRSEATLHRMVHEVERYLRDHIQAQVGQIREALVSQEKLDLARHATDVERIESVKREVGIQRIAGEQAIAKAEAANEKRFEALDEIREQVSLQAADFLRRDVAEAQYEELRRSVSQLAEEYRRAIADINQRLGKIT